MTADHPDIESRVSAHDAEIQNIGKRLDRIDVNLEAIAQSQQRRAAPNWNAISVGLGFLVLCGGMVGYALNNQQTQIDRLQVHHDREVERNNALEHWQGREEMLTELYMRGMLKFGTP